MNVESINKEEGIIKVVFQVVYLDKDNSVFISELNGLIKVIDFITDFPNNIFEIIKQDCIENKNYNIQKSEVNLFWEF